MNARERERADVHSPANGSQGVCVMLSKIFHIIKTKMIFASLDLNEVQSRLSMHPFQSCVVKEQSS